MATVCNTNTHGNGDDEEANLKASAKISRGGEDSPRRRWKLLHPQTSAACKGAAIVVCLVVFFRVALFVLGYDVSISFTRRSRAQPMQHAGGSGSGEACGLFDAALTTKAPNANIWAPISPEDNTAVWDWLHYHAQGLNLTLPDKAKINDNQVHWIDTVPLNKSDVLPFLQGSGNKPKSFARVIIYEGGKADPVSQEYMVGPLPVSAETKMEKLDYIYNGGMGGAVPLNARGVDASRRVALDELLAPAMSGIADITAAIFSGAQYHGLGTNRSTVTVTFGTPNSLDGTTAHANAVFHHLGPAFYLLPIDFYVLIDWTGTDSSLWSIKGFSTKSRFFTTAAELRAAFEAGELWQDIQPRSDYDWALTKYQPDLGERPLERRTAPRSTEVGGKRYKVDAKERYVEYMGWSFFISHSRALGLMFYDIRFKGERILYELSMQEAASQYGGFQPKAGSTVFHDASYSLSTFMFPLVEGYDCPFGSTMWNVSYHEGNRTVFHPNSICIFEQDSGHPLSRHRAADRESEEGVDSSTGRGFENLGVVKNAELNVRFIATIGNYDYIFNYAFGLDGSLDVSVRASGYLMSSPYYPDQGRFGPRIQRAIQGSIHDHIITFKADFDIINSTNSLQKTELKAVTQSQPWFPDLGTFEQLQLESSMIQKEQQMNWAPNHDSVYSVVNSKATNAWGEKRGYRIVPGKSNIHLNTMNSPWSRQNMQFSKSHLSVTRQHDSEPFANSVHNVNLPWKPQQDFSKFFDDENIDGEDIVVWFNLGMHHFTRSEDIPVTLFSEAVSSITFAPQNFFDRAQDGDLRNRVWITSDEAAQTHSVETYGMQMPQGHTGVGVSDSFVTEP